MLSELTHAWVQTVMQELTRCVEDNTAGLDEDKANAFLDADAADDARIAIDPTVEVNGGQVRGAFEPAHVTAALCSGFSDGTEPASCLDFSPDECAQGSAGFSACSSGYFAAAGRTRCERTFEGFECLCAACSVLHAPCCMLRAVCWAGAARIPF